MPAQVDATVVLPASWAEQTRLPWGAAPGDRGGGVGQFEVCVMGARSPTFRVAGAGALVVAALSSPRIASSPSWLLFAGGLAAAAAVVAMTRQARAVWVTGLPAAIVCWRWLQRSRI
jgi:hypothetical protein